MSSKIKLFPNFHLKNRGNYNNVKTTIRNNFHNYLTFIFLLLFRCNCVCVSFLLFMLHVCATVRVNWAVWLSRILLVQFQFVSEVMKIIVWRDILSRYVPIYQQLLKMFIYKWKCDEFFYENLTVIFQLNIWVFKLKN